MLAVEYVTARELLAANWARINSSPTHFLQQCRSAYLFGMMTWPNTQWALVVCLQGWAAAEWPGRISVMSQIINGMLVWIRETSRALTRDSHFRGIFLAAGEVTKGVQAFHDNALCDWSPETERFVIIIISRYCLMELLFRGGCCLGFCREEAWFGKRNYSS